MSQFLRAIDNYDIDYLMHHGVKGMQWGVRKGPSYVPVGQRRPPAQVTVARPDYQSDGGVEYPGSRYPYDDIAGGIQNAPPERVQSTAAKVWKRIGIGVGVAGLVAAAAFGGKKWWDYNHESILTEAGKKYKEEHGL